MIQGKVYKINHKTLPKEHYYGSAGLIIFAKRKSGNDYNLQSAIQWLFENDFKVNF